MTKITSAFLILFIALSAAGCTDHRIKRNKVKCEKYGFLPGTDAFARCVQHGVMNDERRLDELFEDDHK